MTFIQNRAALAKFYLISIKCDFLVGTTTTGDEGHSVESSQQAQGQNQAPTSAQEGATAGRRSDSDAAGFDQDWVRRSQEVSK